MWTNDSVFIALSVILYSFFLLFEVELSEFIQGSANAFSFDFSHFFCLQKKHLQSQMENGWEEKMVVLSERAVGITDLSHASWGTVSS